MPLFSLHIPKCSGQSFRQVLKHWFGGNFLIHYFQQYNGPPPRHEPGPGTCIHGHFNREIGIGVMDHYPEANQFIVLLRNPLEMALSNYFFWKRKARARQIDLGLLQAGGEHDYRDIDDFFKKRPKSHMLKFMPWEFSLPDYKRRLDAEFIWIGLVEYLQRSLNLLSDILGFDKITCPHVNASPRDEDISPSTRRAFLDANRLEFAIYEYVRTYYES